ncbi:hypothetical protein DV096_19730 [Bradymonadaceae bacterium TMQ3]|uniref:Uncharacterized protein n=1 Tax=Lujinxingia sediminis TaxID=2480984 RepID=A0ABY0CN32_9DELT|nr:hypothetical protein [Lujinxingia sediminis]RDV36283.1 hypothetical protein DV096_19730 [Bradymonadaceae bacterium TMQ3]RVU41075.1 hypothetical protein EA187_19435 [Lujinxingia sediminis]TXC67871.1 hypothetical protein FRC91_19510 [Bradymonadales bacterium TMQ1]
MTYFKTYRLLGLLLATLLIVGCNVDDTNSEVEDPVETDAGDDTGEEPETLPAEASQWCAAGGVATGSGYRLVHCTAPANAAGNVASGEGLRLEMGASQVIVR